MDLGFELDGRYRIGHVLGKPGGFGITYLAFDERLQARVALKEYLPREIAARGSDGASVRLYSADEEETFEYGLDRFLGEARALAQFDHANIVGVQDFFEANGTAYLAMDYYEGKTLKQYLAEQPEGQIDPDNATEIMLRVLDGLKEVHAEGYLHRDVKPSNIYLTAEGRPILIDFGAARLALGERSRSLSVVMTEGYAPYEQYSREGNQGPHTDVYGCGATLYRMVTGQKPPPATDRVIEDRLEAPSTMNPAVPEGLSRAITDALAMGDEVRISTSAELQDRLRAGLQDESAGPGSSEERAAEMPRRADTEGGSDGDGRSRLDREGAAPAVEEERSSGIGWGTVAVGVLLVAALGLGGVAMALYPSGEEGAVQGTERTAGAGPSSGSEQPSSSDPPSSSADRSRTEQLLEEARGHLDAGRLTRPEGTNALSAVQQALEQDPGSEEAQQLLGRIADRLVEKGAAAREEGNLQAASSFFERSLRIESQPKVRDELESVRGRIQEQEKYERLLSEVRSTLNEEAPKASELEAAAGAAREAQKLRPESGEGERLLDQIADRAASLGESAEASFQYGKAVRYYQQSLELRDDTSTRKKVESARKIQAGRVPIRTLRGHDRTVTSVAFSPEGSLVATGSHDGTARLWSTRTGEEVQVLRGHKGLVYSVAFSPDGSRVATGSADTKARLWSAATGEQVQVLRGHEGRVSAVAFSPDGSFLATGSSDGTARLWSVGPGEEFRVLRGHEDRVWSVAFSPSRQLVATGSRDGTARVWSVQTGYEFHVLSEHNDPVTSVAFSPDGSRVATGSWDSTARLWSAETGEKVQVLQGNDDGIKSVAFSPAGSLVATGSHDATARLWSTQTGEEVQVLRGHEDEVESVAFSPDGRLVATGSEDGTAKLWYVPQEL
ncbi:serine/threonine-protein kinase [Salinibacter ruber]|uniref:serine/threonine-protein kinase n=1 Tax=Salinibacter ruber TaxID=146919 RepID=UPI002074165A|nr:serine/threonine-protein kinase [Salinibacter ruber]